RIAQRGTHEQLLQQPGIYLDTYNIQYSDFPQMQVSQSFDEASAASEGKLERGLGR
ncbi:MAG: hypothetical protein K0R75_3544, partial [Paenibacillaceae bacterium]|nr:hypothetical protein [Paenibacillaceae bacterium]